MENQIKFSDTKRLIDFLRSKSSAFDSIDGEKVAVSRLMEMGSPLAVEVLFRSLRHDSNDTKMTVAKLHERRVNLSKFLKLERLDEEQVAKLFEISVISSYRSQRQKPFQIKLLFMFAPDSIESQEESRVARLSRHGKIKQLQSEAGGDIENG